MKWDRNYQAKHGIKTGKAETERETLEEQNARDEQVIAGHASKAQRAEATLRKLMELAHCSAGEELEASIAGAEQKVDKLEEYERITSGLIERNAVPDIRQIEEGALGYQVDSLLSAIASSETRQKELQDDVFKTGGEHGNHTDRHGYCDS